MMAVAAKQEEEEEEAGNWSELPYHVLHLIMDRLTHSHSISDYIRCSSVCVSWRSAFNNHNLSRLPFLMVPSSFSTFTSTCSSQNIFDQGQQEQESTHHQLEVRRFYSITSEKVDDMLKVRMPYHSQCRGSSHGWLIIVDDVDEPFPVRLFNPFLSPSLLPSSKTSSSSSLEGFVLPSLKNFPTEMDPWNSYKYWSLRKAVLSANPISNPTDYIVMIINGEYSELAFHKPGDKGWTQIKSPSIKDSKDGFFDDVIYYQHKFFAIHSLGTVVVCDDLAAGAAARVLLQPPETKYKRMKMHLTKMYLVESSGGSLLQVHRDVYIAMSKESRLIYSTQGFRVFKLLLRHNHPTKAAQEISALEPSDYKWEEMKNLCGDTLFLGQNASISISASAGCKPNSIYYTDDSDIYITNVNDGPHDIGIFNLEDGTFERYFSTDLNNTSIRPVPIWPIPIWIPPSLQKTPIKEFKINLVNFSTVF